MSAEGKKKRGISGMSNAQNIPFRYGGSKCNLDTKTRSTNSPYGAGSKLVQAMALEAMLTGQKHFTERLLKWTDASMERCTHPLLT